MDLCLFSLEPAEPTRLLRGRFFLFHEKQLHSSHANTVNENSKESTCVP
jgi:hypothetical protein